MSFREGDQKPPRSNVPHSHPNPTDHSYPPRQGWEGCPLLTTNLCPRKARGTPSTTTEYQPTPVLCDPQLTTARALSIHQALKTRMNRFCRRNTVGHWGWWNVLDMLNLMSRCASTVQLPTNAQSFNYHIETVLVAEISTHIFGCPGGDFCCHWDRFCVHV